MSTGETPQRSALEEDIKRRFDAGDLRGAASRGLEGYGPEILGFLAAIHREPADASDVFGEFCEQLWKSLDRFAWRSSFRTWAYTIARRVSLHYLQGPIKRVRRQVRLSQSPDIQEMADQVRTRTLAYLRTQVKDRFQELRDRLPPDDRQLLVLRVDRKMAWKDIAAVMLQEDGASSEAVKRESARLRKRFELVKDRLRRMGREEGLLEPG